MRRSLRAIVTGSFVALILGAGLQGVLGIATMTWSARQVTALDRQGLVPAVGLGLLSQDIDQERALWRHDSCLPSVTMMHRVASARTHGPRSGVERGGALSTRPHRGVERAGAASPPLCHPRRQESLLCQLKRHWGPITDSAHGLTTCPNLLLETQITHLEAQIARLNQVWVADITYIRPPRGFAYLAAILDAFSRLVVGRALARWIDTALTLRALDQAPATRPVAPGLIHHPDRGVQYASRACIERRAPAARPFAESSESW